MAGKWIDVNKKWYFNDLCKIKSFWPDLTEEAIIKFGYSVKNVQDKITEIKNEWEEYWCRKNCKNYVDQLIFDKWVLGLVEDMDKTSQDYYKKLEEWRFKLKEITTWYINHPLTIEADNKRKKYLEENYFSYSPLCKPGIQLEILKHSTNKIVKFIIGDNEGDNCIGIEDKDIILRIRNLLEDDNETDNYKLNFNV